MKSYIAFRKEQKKLLKKRFLELDKIKGYWKRQYEAYKDEISAERYYEHWRKHASMADLVVDNW